MTETTRAAVALRPLTVEDAEELGVLYGANRDFLRPFEPRRPDTFYTAAGQRERLRGVEAGRAEGSGESWAITAGSGIVGTITLSGIARGFFQSANLGYWVAAACNGRGYASQAVAQVLDFAFGQLSLHRVQAGTLVDNLGSQRVLEHNGFTRIGLARRYLQIDGAWQDHLLFEAVAE
ncbi:MAG: GNAT family N-acetyltransferase [Actinomycetales bacterium]